MPSDSVVPNSAVPRRLHPISLLFMIQDVAKQFLVPALVVIAASFMGGGDEEASDGSRYELWAAVFFVPTTLIVIVRYYSYRYSFLPDELLVKEGLLNKKERHVPYERIQNIDTTQTALQRLFKVAEATVETASGTEPEARLRVLSLPAIEEMRAHVFRHRSSVVPETAAESSETVAQEAAVELVRVPLRDLLLLGLFSKRGFAVVSAAFALGWQMDLLDFERIRVWLSELPAFQGSGAVTMTVAFGGLFMITVVALSMFLTVLSLYDFKLVRRGDELRTTMGLLTRRSYTIPRHRIQVLQVKESLWMRWFGRVSVRVQTAGGSGDESAARTWLVPSLPQAKLMEFLDSAHPELSQQITDWQPLHPSARWRLIRTPSLVVLIPTVALSVFLNPWVWTALAVVLPTILFFSIRHTRYTGYHLGLSTLHYRTGVLQHTQSIVPLSKVQAVYALESPFDRRWEMGTVGVDTAGSGTIDEGVLIRFLPKNVSSALRVKLADATAQTEFRW